MTVPSTSEGQIDSAIDKIARISSGFPIQQADKAVQLNDLQTLENAKSLHSLRRKRDILFQEAKTLFKEPAWDLLLYLFIAAEQNKEISIKSACSGAAVAHSTGLRVIRAFEHRGIVACFTDPLDSRRRFVALKEPFVTRMRISSSGVLALARLQLPSSWQ